MKKPIDLHIHLPPDVHRALWRLAQQHERSLNKELLVALRLYIAQQEREQSGRGAGVHLT